MQHSLQVGTGERDCGKPGGGVVALALLFSIFILGAVGEI